MKKKLPIILLGVILACVLVFGFLYANNDIGKTANSLEADIRQSQKILDDWIVDGSISDTMAAFISVPSRFMRKFICRLRLNEVNRQ